MAYTVDTVTQIWNDKSGERIEVGPDTDGLDLVEIRYYADDSKPTSSITMVPEQACLVAAAIEGLAAELRAREKK